MTDAKRRSISRRAFVKSAVAIGGASALAACRGREDVDLPTGPDDLSTLPERQHAWNDHLSTDDYGNVIVPRHRVLLLLDYAGEGTPTDAERERVETAFRSLERAYPRRNESLLFTASYSPRYFDRFDAGPAGVDGDGTYLAASMRTPHNRYPIPFTALSATLTRDGASVFDGPLAPTLDPSLGYHYGAVVDGVELGDDLRLQVDTPPQVARHEGYETAFLQMEPATLSVS